MAHTIDGLHVETFGNGPLVVLVHGTAPPVWGDLVDRLVGAGRTVLVYPRRSFPPSDPSRVSSLGQHADDLAALIDAHGGHADVIGWSIGGVVALDLSARRPQCIDSLVLLEAALHLKRRPSPAMIRAVVGAQIRARRDPAAGARRFLTWALGRVDGSSDLDRLDHELLDTCGPAIVAELALGTGERELHTKDLAAITTPVRWLVGSASQPAFTRAATRASEIMPAVSLEHVPGAGHLTQLDAPEAVVAALADTRRPRN
jgi:pimeloyl-ACP methyl ester carboxylesterase